MAILKKTLFKQNLDRVNTLVYDTDENSKYFQITQLPDTFTGGKNAFLIQGSPFLVNGTQVKIEIKDALGETIYVEPAKGNPEPYDGVSKVVAVHIYPDTAFGPCTITVLGELSDYVDENGSVIPVPDIWKDSYNVKWQRVVNVNPNLANTTKIRFYKTPKFDITEEILPIYNRNPSIVTVSSSIDGFAINPSPGTDYRTFNGLVNYQLKIKDDSIFSQSMEGLKITIDNVSQSYSPTISDVYTSKLAIVNIPYYETSSASPNFQEIKNFQSASFTASYENSSIVSDSNINSSFAKIKITDLDTFTGDVHRIKVFAKSQNWLGDFELLEDVQLESSDLLVADTFSSSLNVRKGIFTEPILNAYWITGSITTNVSSQVDDSTLIKSVKLTPTSDSLNDSGLFYFATSESIDFTSGTEYQLDFTPLLSASAASNGIMQVYLTGSAFVDTDINFGYGKLLTTVSSKTNFRRFDKQQINFLANSTGNGKLLFLVKSGVWQLTDISLSTAAETSFSPNEITLNVNVPNKINNEQFEFKFEFYDVNNNYVPADFRQTFTFVGGNDIVAGKNILLNVSNNSFAFNAAGTEAFPEFINFNVQTIAITGSVAFYSAAFDDSGSLIPITETPYPGLLQKLDDNNWRLTSQSFSGSLSDYKVGAITYTASADGVERYATIYRLNEGKVGKTGAGIVYRGEWSASVDYYRTDTRRDVVMGKQWNGSTLEDRYFLCGISHLSQDGQRPSDDNTGNSIGTNWTNYWEEFSAEFDSVATDILFSQDVYANRTINIGSKGGKPVIALNADWPSYDNPSIRIASDGYNTNGIFLGYDGGIPKFSLRGGNNALIWNGAELVISGSVVATDGKIAGWVIDRESLRDEGNKIILNPKTPSIEIYDTVDPNTLGKKRIDVRYGKLTNTDVIAGALIPIDQKQIQINYKVITGPEQVDESEYIILPAAQTISISANQEKTFYAKIVWLPLNGIADSNETYTGYVRFDRGIEIRDSTNTPIFVTYGPGGNIFSPNSSLNCPSADSNVVITFPEAGNYTVHQFYILTGYFYTNNPLNDSPTLTINSTLIQYPNFSMASEVNLCEITSDGFQVLSKNNQYFRIERNDIDAGDPVAARIAGKVIHTVDSSDKDALVIDKGNIRLNDGKVITGTGTVINFDNLEVSTSFKFGTGLSTVDMSLETLGILRPMIKLNNLPTYRENGLPSDNARNLLIYSSGPRTGLVVREKVTSSERYKKHIKEWEIDALNSVSNISVKNFLYKDEDDNKKLRIGLIAEDLAANGLEDYVSYDENGKIDEIYKNDLVFVLWKAVNQMNKRIKELEKVIEQKIRN
jgi:hypothetical protein